MASVLTMSAQLAIPETNAAEAANGLRCSTSVLSASGSFPILAALFVEEAVEVATEIAIHLSLSQSIPAPTLVEQVVAEPARNTHVNPAKAEATEPVAAPSAAPSAPAAVAPAPAAEEEDEYPVPVDEYDDRWDDDGWGDDDRDYDLMERLATKAFKLERRPKGTSSLPLRATKDNKKEKLFPNRRVGHRLAAKMDRSKARKLENNIAHKSGRPTPVYWQPDERRIRSQEERDIAEALRRSRRDGNVSQRLTVQALLDLQNRELTPEDYEMLLLLDETVEKKKVSKATFAGYPQTILTADLPVDCPICMSPMATGEKVTTLPCSHQYHTPCIEQWLTNSSPNCPLDGLSLLHDH